MLAATGRGQRHVHRPTAPCPTTPPVRNGRRQGRHRSQRTPMASRPADWASMTVTIGRRRPASGHWLGAARSASPLRTVTSNTDADPACRMPNRTVGTPCSPALPRQCNEHDDRPAARSRSTRQRRGRRHASAGIMRHSELGGLRRTCRDGDALAHSAADVHYQRHAVTRPVQRPRSSTNGGRYIRAGHRVRPPVANYTPDPTTVTARRSTDPFGSTTSPRVRRYSALAARNGTRAAPGRPTAPASTRSRNFPRYGHLHAPAGPLASSPDWWRHRSRRHHHRRIPGSGMSRLVSVTVR